MKYEPKDFSKVLGTPGFSENLLKTHFVLYEGYVAATTKLCGILENLRKQGKEGTPEYAELKRRFGWEWNGMRLHELYFANLGGSGEPSSAPKALDVIKSAFGSYDEWLKDFKATGAMRGIGWVVLYYDGETGNAFNSWINEHDVAHLTGTIPLLVMDVFEHAYMLDYGIKRVDYIEAFVKAIDWVEVEQRIPF